VVVVKDDDEIIRDGGDLIEQGCQDRFGGRRLRGLENPQHPASKICHYLLQCGDEVSQKACGVAIPFIQRQPGDRSIDTGDPFDDQRVYQNWAGRE
jgi:hypothetical protein